MYFPSATYRVQLNSSYTLKQLQSIIGYLHKLGISTVYAAPITTSAKGSTHGYDVCDPDILNSEIGTEAELQEIHRQLSEKGMGWLQDIVPNHMAFLCNNKRLQDVMERGPDSPYYEYFDINWNHFDPVYKGKLMVPFIGKDVNEAVDADEIKLTFDNDGFHIAYFDEKYPVAAGSLSFILSHADSDLSTTLPEKKGVEIDEWKKVKQDWLQGLQEKDKIEKAVEKINTDKSLLRRLLDEQHYRLTWYSVTDKEIDFRRFFTVNQLICLKMEDEFVFTNYHQFILRLFKQGLIQGLRIDHIDGLYNPQEYVARLRNLFGEDCYIIAEKILEYNEDIARDWNLRGTSGYEFLSFTNQLLTDKKGADKILAFYKELVPQTPPYEDMVFQKKHTFLLTQMGGELENLLHMIDDSNIFKNYDRDKMKDALSILMACFTVYRIYPDEYPLHPEAIDVVEKAFEKAEPKVGEVAPELDLLKTVFLTNGTKAEDANKLLFLKRLMQFTGPLAAKGVEDTTFYVYNPLISHNEVGDSPSQLGVDVAEFHRKMQSRQKNNPYSLSATSTHDTKRGEDGRMRINALAAIPDEWIRMVNQWRQMNTPFIKTIEGKPAPTTNDEYFIYQSLIGAFPEDMQITDSYKERTAAFLQKALREAKVETTYNEPNEAYEEACQNFVSSLFDEQHPFLESFRPFLEKVIDVATSYSLAQTLIKITAPGIPDIYQGCELWDVSYVDPDNRRPVDYDCRQKNLDEIIELAEKGTDEVLRFIHQYKKEGREKLYVTYKALQVRTQHNDLFLEGDYLPLETSHDKVLAFARKKNDQCVIVVIPFTDDVIKEDIRVKLPVDASQSWQSVLSGGTITANGELAVGEALQKFPVGLFLANL